MGAGAISALMVSCLINGYIITRDLTHGTIAGAISVGASSLYITTPVYAFIAGAAGGIIQVLIQNLIEKRASNTKLILSTVSWSLYGLQGLIGAGFAAGWKAIYFTNTHGLNIEPKTLDFTSQFELYGGLISAGIGAAFGVVTGIIIIFVNGQKSKEYFEDYHFWFANDGVRYDNAVEITKEPVKHAPVYHDVVKHHE
jgi:ammonia channel protein AmtB